MTLRLILLFYIYSSTKYILLTGNITRAVLVKLQCLHHPSFIIQCVIRLMLRYKRFCDSNAHVTTYETVAPPNGRSSEWSLFTRHYHHTQKSTSGVNKQKMLAYRTAILLLISYFYGHSKPEQHGKPRVDLICLHYKVKRFWIDQFLC